MLHLECPCYSMPGYVCTLCSSISSEFTSQELCSTVHTVKVLITAPKNLILIFSWRIYWSQKILLKSLVALKLGWCLVNRTLHTKAQRFLFSKRRFKKFSTAVGAINRAQQSSLTSKWRYNSNIYGRYLTVTYFPNRRAEIHDVVSFLDKQKL